MSEQPTNAELMKVLCEISLRLDAVIGPTGETKVPVKMPPLTDLDVSDSLTILGLSVKLMLQRIDGVERLAALQGELLKKVVGTRS